MELKLGHRLQQTLALSPQLIQSIKMLQLTTVDLEQLISDELMVNPVLEAAEIHERLPDPEASASRVDDVRALDNSLSDWKKFADGMELGFRNLPDFEDREEIEGRGPAREESIYEHLMKQVGLSRLSEDQRPIAEFLIGSLDERGYLTVSPREAAEMLECTDVEIDAVLVILQTFDPPGIGARDLRECMLIQLRERGLEHSLAYKLARDHLKELGTKTAAHFAKAMKIEASEVQDAIKVLSTLDPSPGGGYAMPAATITPDIAVEKINDEWTVVYNDGRLPVLQLSKGYTDLLKQTAKLDVETKTFLRDKFESANFFITSLHRRRDTLVKVMRCVVAHQDAFFERGPSALKPLTMEAVAEEVGVHLSTVSRVANGKYAETPWGMFELRYFFSSGLAQSGGDGEDLSTRSVKQLLRDLILAEDKAEPLSDQALMDALMATGIQIARRTVAKYREELGFPVARMRKR